MKDVPIDRLFIRELIQALVWVLVAWTLETVLGAGLGQY